MRQLKYLGNQNYMWIFNCAGVGALISALFKVQRYNPRTELDRTWQEEALFTEWNSFCKSINALAYIIPDIIYTQTIFQKQFFFIDTAFRISVCMHMYHQTLSLPRILGAKVPKSPPGHFKLSLLSRPIIPPFVYQHPSDVFCILLHIQFHQYSLSLFHLPVDRFRSYF